MVTTKALLYKKFEEIQSRTVIAIEQLDDKGVNWRYNDSSNSIAKLVIHIEGNIKERIRKGINKEEITRDRASEFEHVLKSRDELIHIVNQSFNVILSILTEMTPEDFMKTQTVRGKERTHLDMLLQCAAHFSEHMGQILFICKMIKNDDYKTTSI